MAACVLTGHVNACTDFQWLDTPRANSSKVCRRVIDSHICFISLLACLVTFLSRFTVLMSTYIVCRRRTRRVDLVWSCCLF
jgi:hypothetical protein